MEPASTLPNLLLLAWLLPLASFVVISIGYSLPQLVGARASYATSKYAGTIATGAIGTSFLLSLFALFAVWLPAHPLEDASHHHHGAEDHGDNVATNGASLDKGAPSSSRFRLVSSGQSHAPSHNNKPPPYYAGDWYDLCNMGKLKLSIGYYIDTLTLAMFCMVTLIATSVHVYATGYMHDELHDFTDPEVTLSNGEKLQRPGRYHRFFQYLSLFCFSMLGVVIAGNMAMVFVFWELVGICSYFLIGFYIERKSASTAANKAFIVNRVGDFGMLIGMMALWTSLGTFSFGDVEQKDGSVEPGIFSLLRTEANDYQLVPPDGMVAQSARAEVAEAVLAGDPDQAADSIRAKVTELRQDKEHHHGHWLLFIAGVGIFCGCVGKSAQFPLHTWLPDAMEGPTPVSALVHSATMVAAGVYLVGRFYPAFSPEALLVIAVVGCITLFIAATIAITATDIKRVLAYSTVSQLGYMMLSLGLGGWVAGLFHLFTHAFFKGLLFMCSGSVIHAVHTNEMTEMGGLRKKMPITAYTMLAGCLAIIGAGIPLTAIGLSGYYSKDAIIEQALSHMQSNTAHGWMSLLYFAPVAGAVITAFYMFRLWYMTFAGEPRDQHRYDHAHESPWAMAGPLVLLAVFAVGVGWTLPFTNISLTNMLDQARPVGTLATTGGALMPELVIPSEPDSHKDAIKTPAGIAAFSAAATGLLFATIVYLWGKIDPRLLRKTLQPLYSLSWHKWWFDELYQGLFVWPTHFISNLISRFDKVVLDSILHASAWVAKMFSHVVNVLGDRMLIDRSVDTFAAKTWDLGLSLRAFQTGKLRQYVMFLAIGTVVLFLVASVWRFAVAG